MKLSVRVMLCDMKCVVYEGFSAAKCAGEQSPGMPKVGCGNGQNLHPTQKAQCRHSSYNMCCESSYHDMLVCSM